MKKVRLAYLAAHPIQYQAPLLRRIAAREDIDLTVFFATDLTAGTFRDSGFGAEIKWDVPLLSGYRYEVLPALFRGRSVGFWLPLNFGLFWRLWRGKFDVLWIHGYARFCHLLSAAVAKLLGIKVLIRDEAWAEEKPRNLLKRLFKEALFLYLRAVSDGFLAIGTLNARYYRSYGVPDRAVFPMPYAVDNERFRAGAGEAAKLRVKLGIDAEQPVILFAGKLVSKKRPGDLLEAYARMPLEGAVKPALVFVGDGALRPALQDRARELGLKRVHFVGFQNQTAIPAYYSLADVFVLPSGTQGNDRETWGLAVNEAMNAGKPVIVSDQVGCGPDLVKHGLNGFIFKTGEMDELAGLLQKLATDRDLRWKMGARSLEIVESHDFSRDMAGLAQALEAITGGARRAGRGEIKRVLYVGDLSRHSNSLKRSNALADLGFEVERLSCVPENETGLPNASIVERISGKLRLPADRVGANRKVREAAGRFRPDLLWVEKASNLRPAALRSIRRNSDCLMAFYCEDNLSKRHNRSLYIQRGLKYYDIAFTKTGYDKETYRRYGLRRVEYLDLGYDRLTVRPRPDGKAYSRDVIFIGSHENQRAREMRFLADNGIRVEIWGNGWKRGAFGAGFIHGEPLVGEQWLECMHGSKIALNYLRRMNDDISTGRSFEIPGSRSFMLAERSPAHSALFREGREAEFFNSPEEALEKIRFYLAHDAEREAVAEAGYRRCLESGYSNHDRWDHVLGVLRNI